MKRQRKILAWFDGTYYVCPKCAKERDFYPGCPNAAEFTTWSPMTEACPKDEECLYCDGPLGEEEP